MEVNCTECSAVINESAIFCFSCGTRSRCRSCDARLVKDAKFCINCGSSIQLVETSNSQPKNTIVYKRSKDETYCEVSLTDTVGKEGMRELIQGLTSQNNLARIENVNNAFNRDAYVKDTNIEKNDFEDAVIQQEENENKEVLNSGKNNPEQFPHLNDLEMNLEKSESEWILIYAFYLSEFGKKTFTKEMVQERYMAKRKTLTRQKNYSNNWKSLFKEYISTVSENEFKFRPNKIEYINNLISGKQDNNYKIRKRRKSVDKKENNDSGENVKIKKSKGVHKHSYSMVPELNLIPKGKESLKGFYSQFNAKNNPEIILIIVYYLERILKEKSISENKIYHCYKEIGEPVPELRKSLGNARGRYGWIDTSDFSNLKITISGENHLEHKMKGK